MKFLRLVCLVGVAMTGSVHAGNLIILDPAPAAPAPTASAAPAPTPAAPGPAAPTLFQIEKGKKVDVQLSAYGQRTGWTIVWQAPDYIIDQPMVLPGDFEAAIINFLNGANEAGFRLRAVFYRGNKTVRITEN